MNLHAEAFRHLAQKIEEMKAEGIIQEYRAFFDPARHHVIPATLDIYA